MGKTGAGKSSLCNALFAGEVTPVSDVTACTREALHFRLYSGSHSLVLVDLPGASEMRDEEYEALYRNILPELDLILWVIKADDRTFSIDERFYQRMMADYQHRVLFVVARTHWHQNLEDGDLPAISEANNGAADYHHSTMSYTDMQSGGIQLAAGYTHFPEAM